jgi:hypothetical protein
MLAVVQTLYAQSHSKGRGLGRLFALLVLYENSNSKEIKTLV